MSEQQAAARVTDCSSAANHVAQSKQPLSQRTSEQQAAARMTNCSSAANHVAQSKQPLSQRTSEQQAAVRVTDCSSAGRRVPQSTLPLSLLQQQHTPDAANVSIKHKPRVTVALDFMTALLLVLTVCSKTVFLKRGCNIKECLISLS